MAPYNLRGSWYSQLPAFGWFDAQDKPNSNALGVPDWQQGIALPSRRTLGQWYNVTPPGATIPYPFQQTDTGPAPWTGRGVDISAAAAQQMGFTPQSFPTNAQFKIEPRDEPRGLGSPAGLPVQAGDLPDNAVPDAYASGPSPTRKSSMPSLLDMFSGGFTPKDASGQPQSIDAALRNNSNSLIGLGMGLLQPRSMAVGAPVGNAYTSALSGYMQGAQTDAANAYRQAQLAHQKNQEALQREEFAFRKQQAGTTEAQKAMLDVLGPNASPEAKADFMKKYYEPKTEGDWSVVQVPHPTYPGETIPMWANKRTREMMPFPNTPTGAPGGNLFAGAVNPLAPGGATAGGGGIITGQPSGGGVSYGPAGMGGQGFGTGAVTPAYPGGSTQAVPAGSIPPAPPGSDPKEWRKEQTKMLVKQAGGQEVAKKSAADVMDALDRSINLVQNVPGRTTGMTGQLLSHVGGSEAANLAGQLRVIKANVSFDKLNEMRRNSPTGGALGNVSDKDMALLQSAIGDLEQSRDPATVLYNLGKVRNTYHEVINGPGTAPPNPFSLPKYQQAPQPGAGTRTGGAAVPKEQNWVRDSNGRLVPQ